MSCLPIRWTKRSMSDSPGRVSGSKRLRADLARKVAKQTARAVDLFHAAGLVHGGSSYSGVQVVHSQADVWRIHSLWGRSHNSNILFGPVLSRMSGDSW